MASLFLGRESAASSKEKGCHRPKRPLKDWAWPEPAQVSHWQAVHPGREPEWEPEPEVWPSSWGQELEQELEQSRAGAGKAW